LSFTLNAKDFTTHEYICAFWRTVPDRRAHARGGRTQTRREGRAGPFTIGPGEHSGHPMRNFAVPDDGAAPGAAGISALVAFFRGHDRIPRLEFIGASAPAVTPALLAAGFTAEARTPVMACVPGMTLTPRDPAGVTVREAVGDVDLAAAAGVRHHACAGPSPPGPRVIAQIRAMTARGGIVTIAVDNASGSVAGTGLADVPGPGAATGELAAVGVLTAFRRRGIASAVSAHLARTAHDRGIRVVFPEALPDEKEIYRRAGFADVSAKAWLSLR
jgi:GNAT superfamily N-acetyltransferase